MRISTSLLLPALISAASAIPDTASVYIFQGEEFPNSADAQPILTPEQARLVIAQRLGVSQYHSLKGANGETLSYINKFSGHEDPLFDGVAQDKAAELVMVIDNVSPETAEPLLSSWKSIDPAFFVSKPPSFKANQKLTRDLNQQRHGHGDAWDMECDLKQAINPYNEKCWAGRTKMLHLDLKKQAKNYVSIDDFMAVEETLRRLAKKQEMNLMVILMPTSSTKISSKAYGSYQMPSSALGRRQQQAEEIITEVPFTSSPSSVSHISQVDQGMAPDTTFPPLRGVIAWCHSSIEACMSATNNCSGHGSCFAKYNSTDNPGDGKSGCFTCGCLPEKSFVGKSNGTKTTYWGGAACNKKDVSGPFWLLFVLSLFLVAIVGYSISLLFSIGEERLPGVIGAGVSSKSR